MHQDIASTEPEPPWRMLCGPARPVLYTSLRCFNRSPEPCNALEPGASKVDGLALHPVSGWEGERGGQRAVSKNEGKGGLKVAIEGKELIPVKRNGFMSVEYLNTLLRR
jgi:hypothetical protein